MKTNVIFDTKKDTVSLTDVGKVRQENEDNLGYAETINGDVFVVCDGMGGHVGGKEASTIAVDSIIKFFSSERHPNITEAIDDAIRYANSRIYQTAQENTKLRGMGTTVVVTVIQEDKVYIGHVGDSRIYLMSDNHLYRLTADHSYVQKLIEKNIITDEESETHKRKSELLKALGIKAEVEPEIAPDAILLKNGDKIMMCSDGLCGMVNDQTMQATMKSGKNVQEIGKELMQLALNSGGKDNITLHLIQISNSNYKESVFVDKSNKKLESTGDYTDYDNTEDTITDFGINQTTEPEEEEYDDKNVKLPLIKRLLKPLYLGIFAIVIILGFLLFFFLGGKKYTIYVKETAKDTTYIKDKSFKDSIDAKNYFDKRAGEVYDIIGKFDGKMIEGWEKQKRKNFEEDNIKKSDEYVIKVRKKGSKVFENVKNFYEFKKAISYFDEHKDEYLDIKIVRGLQMLEEYKKGSTKDISVKNRQYFIMGRKKETDVLEKIKEYNDIDKAEEFFENKKNDYFKIQMIYNEEVIKQFPSKVEDKKDAEKIVTKEESDSDGGKTVFVNKGEDGSGVDIKEDTEKVSTDNNPTINKEDKKEVSTDNNSTDNSGNITKDSTDFQVPSGKGWNYVCNQFKVCKDRILDENGNNIVNAEGKIRADAKLKIPLRFSADKKYNPDKYKDFEKEWNGCIGKW